MIEREIFKDILEWLDEDRIIIIKGARQTGKTTLLLYLKKYLEKMNKKIAYFSIDRDRFNPIYSSPELLVKFLHEQFSFKISDKIYLLLDEFQYLEDPGLFLKVLFDSFRAKLKIIVSGSSSLEISKTREYLTGRKIEFILERFNFREFLKANSQYSYDQRFRLTDDDREITDFLEIYKNDLRINLLDFINWGGYPEIVLTSDIKKKHDKLKEIINTYIRKDIVDFMKLENITGFNNLVSLFSRCPGSITNKTEVSNTLGINFRTLKHYIEILQYTFVFSFIPPYFTNIRKEISKMPKVYANDLGIITLNNSQRFHEFDLIPGNIIENFVFLCLKQYFPVYYYRTISKAEIDFIGKKGSELLPFEVKFTKKPKVPIKIFSSFSEKYHNKLSFIITSDTFGKRDNIVFIPVILLPFMDFS